FRSVCGGNVDLAKLLRRRVSDLQARQQAELNGLLSYRKRAGYHRLAGDDGRGRRQYHQRQQSPSGSEQEKRVLQRRRVREDETALAEIVQGEGGGHQPTPGGADRTTSEMPHISIERFGSGDGQKNGAQDDQGDEAVLVDEEHGVDGIDGSKNVGAVADMQGAQSRDHDEPEQHDRPEEAGDAAGP